MAEQVFKNVQILKGIPVDEFMDTMGMFAAALALNCIDCHTPDSVGTWDNFAKETPLKQTSRKMLLMVNDINKDNFAGVRAVTCYTCHRADLRPKPVPNLAAQYAEHVEDANEVQMNPIPGGPTADQVFDKYIQALGGAQRLATADKLYRQRDFHRFRNRTIESAGGHLCKGAESTRHGRSYATRRQRPGFRRPRRLDRSHPTDRCHCCR